MCNTKVYMQAESVSIIFFVLYKITLLVTAVKQINCDVVVFWVPSNSYYIFLFHMRIRKSRSVVRKIIIIINCRHCYDVLVNCLLLSGWIFFFLKILIFFLNKGSPLFDQNIECLIPQIKAGWLPLHLDKKK